MKTRHLNKPSLIARSSNLIGLCTLICCALSSVHLNAQTTWTGGTSSVWNNAGNWSNGVPVGGTALNFGGAVYGAPANFPTNNDLVGLTTGAINFTNNGVVAAVGPPVVVAQNTAFTLGTLGQSITLGGNITTSISGSAPANSGFTDTINLNLVLNASRTINANVSGTRSHNLNVFGLISEDGSGPYVLTKSGGAGLGLANTANTFAGDMTISGGTVVATSIQPSGIDSSIGKGSVINLSGGSLNLGGVSPVSAIAATGSINRAINFSGSGGINITTLGNVTFSGTFTNTTATAKTFTLGGDAGPNTFQGNLADNGAGILSFTKGNFSTWTLTGDNTFTGLVDIPSGTLNVATISDTVASNLGLGTNGLKLGQGVQTGTLNYTGNSATTTRQVQIGNNNGTNINGGASIAANGTNGGTGLKFTNAAFNTTRPDAVTTRTLTLGGSNTDANEISGTMIDLNTNLKLALAKSGVGNWIISGNNTYTGNNTISGGTLQVNDSSNGLGDSVAANAVNLNGGTLSLRNDGAGSNGTIIYGSTSNAAGYNVQLSASSTINVGNLTANTGNTVNLGPLTQATVGIRTLNVTGANDYTLTLPSFGLNPLAGQTTTINPTSASIVITGAVTNPMSGFLAVAGANFNTLTLSGTSTGNRIDGVISDAVGGVLDEGDTRITKNGASTWELNGLNTYVGPTAVDGGKLRVTNSIGSSAVTVSGSGTILASDAVATIGRSLIVNSGAILAVGDAANATTATATVNGATTFNNGSIFSWDINATGDAYDKLVTTNVSGQASPTGDAIFRLVAADASFADTFWDTTQTWNNIFTTDGSAAIANWAAIFGNTVSVVNSSFASITPAGGSFSLSGSTLTWTAVPEPTTALAGLLITAGLLRRRRI